MMSQKHYVNKLENPLPHSCLLTDTSRSFLQSYHLTLPSPCSDPNILYLEPPVNTDPSVSQALLWSLLKGTPSGEKCHLLPPWSPSEKCQAHSTRSLDSWERIVSSTNSMLPNPSQMFLFFELLCPLAEPGMAISASILLCFAYLQGIFHVYT